jgi:hypothetical protein
MNTMKLSTVLLSSAALLVAGAAYAADLPAKKAAPAAAAPTGCASFGAGYIAIPGGDTCIKISGYVESDTKYYSPAARPASAPYSMSATLGLGFDTATASEMGTVKSQILLESASPTATFANVSVGGFTAGKADGLLDWSGGYNATNAWTSSGKVAQLQYSAALGSGTTLSVAATAAADNNYSTNAVASRPDLVAAISTTMGAVTVKAGAASHEAVGMTSGTAQGYAFVGQVKFDAGVASIMGYASYANAAAYYLGGNGTPGTSGVADVDANAGNQSSGSNFEGQIDVPVGKNDTIGLTATQLNVSQSTNKVVRSDVGFSVKHTIAKGLWVRPEIYQTTADYGSGATTSQGLYIRIERDF